MQDGQLQLCNLGLMILALLGILTHAIVPALEAKVGFLESRTSRTAQTKDISIFTSKKKKKK